MPNILKTTVNSQIWSVLAKGITNLHNLSLTALATALHITNPHNLRTCNLQISFSVQHVNYAHAIRGQVTTAAGAIIIEKSNS